MFMLCIMVIFVMVDNCVIIALMYHFENKYCIYKKYNLIQIF